MTILRPLKVSVALLVLAVFAVILAAQTPQAGGRGGPQLPANPVMASVNRFPEGIDQVLADAMKVSLP